MKRGVRKGLSHAEGGGGTKSLGVVFMRWLEVLVILKGRRAQKVSTLLKGEKNCYRLWGGGGGRKSFRPAIFSFCSPPLPVIIDQSLLMVGWIHNERVRSF